MSPDEFQRLAGPARAKAWASMTAEEREAWKATRVPLPSPVSRHGHTKSGTNWWPIAVAASVIVVVWFSLRVEKNIEANQEAPTDGTPREIVSGAFGVLLGEATPAGVELKTNEDGNVSFDFPVKDGDSIFKDATAHVDSSGKVYSISVLESFAEQKPEIAKAALMKLESKYGLQDKSNREKRRFDTSIRAMDYSDKSPYFVFGTRPRIVWAIVDRNRVSLGYEDTSLARANEAKIEAKKEAEAGKVTKGI